MVEEAGNGQRETVSGVERRRCRYRGVDRLEAGDRRPRLWPETKEEKENNGGCEAGKKKKRKKVSSGGFHAAADQFCPPFPFFLFNSTTQLQSIELIIEYPGL